jgi:transcriptional regulator with XRE-family HTH domain
MTWRSTILVAISAPIVEKFRAYLRQEFIRRKNKNPKYSLRAFAQQLKINHATLSTILAGKRKITKRTFLALSKRLALNAKEVSRFMADDPSFKGHKSSPYFALQQDVFSLIADWHFDAILELSQIKKLKLDPKEISRVLGIPVAVAKQSLQTLERLELLKKDPTGRHKIQYPNITNILDPEATSVAQKKHQRSNLEKSIEVLESIPCTLRDHTSTTFAIHTRDIRRVKELVKNFRRELTAFLQREEIEPNDVYQIQISFFPLSQLKRESV